MFGFGKTEQVVPLSIRDGILTFSCSAKYKVGKTAKLKLILVYGGRVTSPTVSVTIAEVQEELDETYTCSGVVRLDGQKLAVLTLQMAYGGIAGADRRASKRLACTARILSRELPSFRAVTVNINMNGAELQCDDPIQAGHAMNLQFDLESVGVTELMMQAVCVWSLEELDEATRRSKYRVGVGFTNQTAKTQAAWSKFYRKLLSTEGASVMLKSMDGGSVTEKKTENAYHEAPTVSSSDPSGSGGTRPPVTGNPFANTAQPQSETSSGVLGAVPGQASGGFTFPPPAQPEQSSQSAGAFAFIQPPAPAPPPTQIGGGFTTATALPPPILPGKLQLNPGPSSQQPGKLNLPETPASQPGGFNFPSSQGSQQPGGLGSQQEQGGGFGFPPPQSGGLSFPPAQPYGGFQLPATQSQQPQEGGSSPFSPWGQQQGFELPSPQQPPGGFSFPPSPPPPPQQGGFSFPPSQPPLPQQGGFNFPPSQPQPPQPPQQGGFSFPPSQPQPPQQGGFSFPPSQPLPPQQGGFGATPSPSGGYFTDIPQQPEKVEPMGIQGANLTFRCRTHASNTPGARKQVMLSLNVGGQVSNVAIAVVLTRVDPGPDGTTVCWVTVLEEEKKIQVLNQLLG